MLFVLKGADFSANKVGNVIVPAIEPLELTKTILSYYTRVITSTQKTTFDNFVGFLVASGIYDKVKYIGLPCLSANTTEALKNAKGGGNLVGLPAGIPATVSIVNGALKSNVVVVGGGTSRITLGSFETYQNPQCGIGFNPNITSTLPFTNAWLIRSGGIAGLQFSNSYGGFQYYAEAANLNSVQFSNPMVNSMVHTQNATGHKGFTTYETKTNDVAFGANPEAWSLFDDNSTGYMQGYTGGIYVIVIGTGMSDKECISLNNAISKLTTAFID